MTRGSVRALARAWLAGAQCVLAAVVLGGCSIDPGANPAFGCEGCSGTCVMGYCLEREDGGGAGGGADGGAADGGGMTDGGVPAPEACDEPGKSEFCYEGPGDTATTGSCKAGMRVCGQGTWGACLGQVLPDEELCNREDDDCDGQTDEDVALGSCSTGQPGACDMGALRCEMGIAVCARATDPTAEMCNGQDEDCDTEVDEDISPVCYPSAPSGCVDDGAGGFSCMGLCVAGVAACVDGEQTACAGQVEPVTEVCTTSGPAQDEDCDGYADNGCSCSSGESQQCYGGPLETLGVGVCHAGNQDCDTNNGTFGPCVGEVLPGIESCDNDGADDDCNGADDDVRDRGTPCTVEGVEGVCRDGWHDCKDGVLDCVGPAPSDEVCNGLDDDCDRGIDEGLLESDENCGECGKACNPGTGCCFGQCVDILMDPLHCGRCGNDCGMGLACCDGNCVDLLSDPFNCSACGRTCPNGGCCEKGDCATIIDPGGPGLCW